MGESGDHNYLTTEDLTSSNWNEKKWLWVMKMF